MKILRTPEECFKVVTDFNFEPCYTNIKTEDGSELRIHHIDAVSYTHLTLPTIA